ncbi:hypothetical protein [uncultured Phenylobacterium sp.]|uniref:hypothetical protein n=1 Tax=uncultured Phenylobacterium sp. TaxID=349273 RepID=UPI0025CD877C|nr:hypothetical protein [uncultured Phenylobacterium sp.]
MRLTLNALPLDANGAQLLRSMLVGDRSNAAADAVIAHAMELGAKFAVVEQPYTDLDYSADYQTFYAGAFKDYPRHTKRVHLFAEDVSDILEGPFAGQGEALEARGYLGFVVVRPISQGPIGRTVLRFPEPDDGLIVRRAARARTRVHLAGAELHVEGAPFIQQEAKVGACAQAAIWMASLPVHIRHRTPRFTMADITRLAVTPTDAILSRVLPAGSDGLNPAHMIRALRGMGHQPLFDVFKGQGLSLPLGYAASMVLRYLDSGLPVILAMDDVGHAVTAVGYVEAPGAAIAPGQTYDCFARALLVNDDQRGPYRLLPLRAADADQLPRGRLMMNGADVLTVDGAVSHMFVPLPPRVFLPAHRADIVARDFLQRQAIELGAHFAELSEQSSQAAGQGVRSFFDAVLADRLVRRTYLTSAARYRHHLSQSDVADSVKVELLDRALPHYVWVTELMDRSSTHLTADGARAILGHLVVNATSSSDPDNDLLLSHTPHVVVHRDMNGAGSARGEVEESAVLVDDDHPYAGRIRR